MQAIRGVLFIVVLAIAATASGKTDDLDPRGSLDLTIREGIKLLEAKKYEDFIRLLMPPQRVRMLEQHGGVKAYAANFNRSGYGDRMLAFMKQLKGVKPTISNNGATATYRFPKAVAGRITISFSRIKKRWYVWT